MKIVGVIQARMNSTRLPGKMLEDISGKPLIEYVIDRVSESKLLDSVVVATSNQVTDQPLREFCKKKGVYCYAGALDDVAKRFLDLAEEQKLDAFVRINGDSPFIDPSLIDELLNIFRENQVDLVTNVLHRTYPKGESVEVISAQALKKAYLEFESADHYEHVTKFFYEHPENFHIESVKLEAENYADVNLCVDDEETLLEARRLYSQLETELPHYSWRSVLALKKAGARIA